MPVSLREVADRAGVARGTVSSVLNNRATLLRISPETQARVQKAAAELGYRPNRLAQSLGKGRTNIIGLMIPGLRNPFFLGLMELAEDQALRSGYDVLPDTAFQMRAHYQLQGKLSGWPVDGVLIWITPNKSLVDYIGVWNQEVPVVYMGYARDDNADYVAVDRDGGVRQAMEHLWSRGYRRIAYLYPWADLQPVDSRYAVYTAVCANYGVAPEKIQLEPLPTGNEIALVTQAGLREAGLKTGISLAQRPKDERPDAILCHNDLVAIGVFNGLRRSGVSVPDEIALVGFDGIDEGLFLDKPLTTVVSPAAEIVDQALSILRARLDQGKDADATPMRVVLPSSLRIGETT
jgi:DNA-binding LacI/PurR family transcriptional regulator